MGESERESGGAGERGSGGGGGGGKEEWTMSFDSQHLPRSPALPLSRSPALPLLILGGGFAGLAAAVDLAEAGRRGLLLERRSFLGGRAYSFTDKTPGDTIDNGQHLR